MSVYIHGMEMPRDCPMCPLSYWTWGNVFRGCNIVSGKRYAMDDPEYANSNKRPEWCPLVPVPEHGRLIDADALIQNEKINTFEAVFVVAEAPTIIPANEGEE